MPVIIPQMDTYSIESDANDQSTSVEKSPYEKKMLFNKFNIKWDRVQNIILEKLNDEKPLPKALQNDLIHHVVNELRAIETKIPMSVFRDVARNITSTFPKSFAFTDDKGKVLDIDCITLATAMINHNFYLNRSSLKRKKNCGRGASAL